jgi:hypothetical protein
MSKLIEYAVIAIIGAAALWWFNDSIRNYYQKPLIEAHKLAIEKQAVANKQSVEALAKSKAVIKTVYVDRIKEIEIYAKTLPPDSACRASPDFVRLYNSISR